MLPPLPASQTRGHMTYPSSENGPRAHNAPAAQQPQPSTSRQALLTKRQLSAAIAMSTRSIDNLQREKKIPVIKISPRCCRYELAAVLRALDRFTIKEVQ